MCASYKNIVRHKVSQLKDIKKTKFSVNALTWIYGVNDISAKKINALLGNSPNAKQHELDLQRVGKMLTDSKVFVDFQLRRILFRRLAFLCGIRCYRGYRLLTGLPCRGQRTKSNGRTPARMLASKRYLPFLLGKPRHLREDFIKNIRKKKKKAIKGHIRVFKKGKKAQLSKTKAKKIRKLKEMKKRVKNKNNANKFKK